ncbi:MAG: DUF4147 domain-containing protein [Balneolaceae bacterium]|nr:DUF4147 domain-containing protein [Balneolaceae bacterium]
MTKKTGLSKKEEAVQYFKRILNRVDPIQILPDIMTWDNDKKILSIYNEVYQLRPGQKIYVIGTGKASVQMALAIEKIFGDRIEDGLIIAPSGIESDLKFIKMLIGSHPLPDSKSCYSSLQLVSFIENIPDQSIVLNLISGGTSSLFCVPSDGLTIDQIMDLYKKLINSGASIHEINTVRIAFSNVKGGRLLEILNKTILVDLIVSDVTDDDKRYIGSGPTTAQEISFKEALKILTEFNLWDDLAPALKNHLHNCIEREISVSKTSDFDQHYSWIISSAQKLADDLAGFLEASGYRTIKASSAWYGDISDFEKLIISKIEYAIQLENIPVSLIFYGECTVKVSGSGSGGRNQELALRMAKQLKNYSSEIVFISVGTDGIDGPTDAAGAVVDQKTYQEAILKGVDPDEYLKNNDSYNFFKKVGGHIKTGPTGNNLMDLQIVLIS